MTDYLFINPGAGNVPDATGEHATANMHQFMADLNLPGAVFTPLPSEDSGRYLYLVRYHNRAYDVDMPGIPLDKVRFTGASDQNAWNYPRLYVDGSSWLWLYAVRILRGDLTDTNDE